MLLVFVVLWVVSFLALNALVPADSVNIFAVLGGLVITAVASWAVERGLKVVWPSSKAIRVGDAQVDLLRRENSETTIKAESPATITAWHFAVSRRARVPKGWIVAAVMLEQSGEQMAVYSLMPPAEFDALETRDRFRRLTSQANDDEGRVRLAGEQRRLHRAEEFRWRGGVEIDRTNFGAYVNDIVRLFPDW